VKRKLIIFFVLTLILTTAVATAEEKILEIGISQEPDGFGTMFSMAAGTQVENTINPTMPMLYRDNNWDLHPNVTQYRPNVQDGTWVVDEENEAMVVHWKLREDITWHDGEPFTTEDFVIGYNITMHDDYPAITKTVARYIEEIEVLGDYEMKLHYNQLYPFADGQVLGFMPMPAHIFSEPYEQDDIEAIVEHNYWRTGFFGIGPYKLKEWVSGSHIELAANPDFYRGKPIIDTIVFRFVEDTETLRFMIETGEVQASINPTLHFDSAIALQRSVDPEKIHVDFIEAITWEHIDLNTRDFEPFQDVRVRRALMHATDKEEILETVYEGVISSSEMPMSPRHPHLVDDAYDVMTVYEYNPERAEALLAAAGFARGPDGIMTHQDTGKKLILDIRTTAGNSSRELAQQILAQQWAEIGIQVEINNMVSTALFDHGHLYKRAWPHMILFAWVSSPTSMGDTIWHMDAIPREENNWEGQNVSGWENEEASEILDEMLQEMDESRRQELNTRFLQLWTRDLPSLPLFFNLDITIWHNNISGIKPTGCNSPDTWNIHQWDIH